MNNFMIQTWINNVLQPLAPTMNHNLLQAMQNHWNLPPRANPQIQVSRPLDLPFFLPEEISQINPILIPWDTHVNQTHPNIPNQLEDNLPPNEQGQAGNPMEKEEELEPLNMELSMEFANRNEVKILRFKENLSKRFIFNCPSSMYKCSRDIRPPRDPTVGSLVVILVPCSTTNPNSTLEAMITSNHQDPIRMNKATSIIFWNVRGANNDEFRRNFRELIDTHKPCLIVLLETRMTSYVTLLNDFNFTEMIEVPAEGQSRGLVVLYDHKVVTVNNFTRRGARKSTL